MHATPRSHRLDGNRRILLECSPGGSYSWELVIDHSVGPDMRFRFGCRERSLVGVRGESWSKDAALRELRARGHNWRYGVGLELRRALDACRAYAGLKPINWGPSLRQPVKAAKKRKAAKRRKAARR